MNLDPRIISGIIIGSASLLAAIISAITLYRQNRKLKSEIKFLSTGMAVAYFFNFIKPLFEKLEIPDIELKHDEKRSPIDRNSLKLDLYIPHSLELEEFNRSKSRLDHFKEGYIMKGEDQLFRVNYKIEKTSKELIIIVDFPNILTAAVKYFENSTKTIDFKPSDEFRKINNKELKNFKDTLNDMIAHSPFKGKVSII